jgi:long-chain fatty acid transport protein
LKKRALPFVAAILLCAGGAHAAGLYVADRGVRPLGRGGAFVAGADDLHAIWYNPAGLADAGTSFLLDLSWLNFSSEFKRKTQVTDAGGTVRVFDYPQVDGSTPFLPIPTIGGSYNFGQKKEFTAALGALAPYTAIASYPLTINAGQPAPSRYSLVTLEGSALVMMGGYFAYKPVNWFRVGGGLQAIVGKFSSRVVFSASPSDRLISAPEDPAYDTLSQLDVGPIFAPSANFGTIIEPDPRFRFGISAQLPFWINAPATVRVRLPTAAPFDRAYQDGDEAQVRFRLPPIFRVGFEFRPERSMDSRTRIEVAYVREFWSLHDSIDLRPENVTLRDVTGFPSPFGVAPISLPRNFQDSNSFRLGGEHSMRGLLSDNWIDLRAGVSYETSGIPQQWVSPLTYDANRLIGSVGAGIHFREHWRVDAMAALALLDGTVVPPDQAQVPRVNPVAGNPTKTEAINGGEYSARAIILGVGINYRF